MPSISRLLAGRQSAESVERTDGRDPVVLEIDDETADEVFSALSSATARSILAALHEQPRTGSEIAEEVDTSLQNTNYHLNKLQDGDLIDVVETWYSDQGREMKVYAPTDGALVLYAGDSIRRSSLRSVVERLVGLVAAFAVVSAVVDRVARRFVVGSRETVAGSGMGPDEPARVAFPAGEVFFLGALLALLVAAAWWYRRPL